MKFFNLEFRRNFFENLLITFLLLLILIFYLWTASTTYEAPFHFIFRKDLGTIGKYHNVHKIDHYNALSDAFLAGQLHLLVNQPVPESFLYKGKYYIYYGPAPAVTLFIPFRLIFGTCLPQDLGATIFGFLGVFFSVLLLRFLIKRFLPATPFWMIFIAVIGLGLCNVVPFELRYPEVYQVVINAAYFFLFGGLYWLVSGYYGKKVILWKMALGSLFLGLATGSRPHFVFWAVFLIYLTFQATRQSPRSRPDRLNTVLIILGPFIFCLLLLAFYNFARFHNIFEFGTTYLAANNPDKICWHILNWPYLWPNLFFFLFQPFIIKPFFPFFKLYNRFHHSLFWTHLPPGYVFPDLAGFLLFLPFNWLIIFCLSFYKKLFPPDKNLKTLLIFLLVESGGILFFISLVSISATMRYLIDFVPLINLISFILWFHLAGNIKIKKIWRLFLNFLMITAIAFGCLFNVFTSFWGSYSLFPTNRPDVYYSIANFFPKPKIGETIFHAKILKFKIIFPQKMKVGTIMPISINRQKEHPFIVFAAQGKNGYIVMVICLPDHIAVSRPRKIKPGQVYNFKLFLSHCFLEKFDKTPVPVILHSYIIWLDRRELIRTFIETDPAADFSAVLVRWLKIISFLQFPRQIFDLSMSDY